MSIRSKYQKGTRLQKSFKGERSRVKTQFQKDCDINVIMSNYINTGLVEHMNSREGHYDDVSQIDFESGMQNIARAKSSFESLPSAIRLKFQNSASKFLKFAEDPKNESEMIELGLLPEKVEEKPPEVLPIVPPKEEVQQVTPNKD